MQAQGTALCFQGHLEQARQVPGTHLQDASQLQSPMRGLPGGKRNQQHGRIGDIMSTPVQSWGF